MYFTDPGGPLAPDQWDVTSAGVYRVSADLGSMSLLTDEMVGPNGIAFSPDERILYVSDARQRHIRAFDMLPNGVIAKQTSRVFADLGGPEPGVADGIRWTAPAISIRRLRQLYILDVKASNSAASSRQAATTTLRRRRLEDALFILGQRSTWSPEGGWHSAPVGKSA